MALFENTPLLYHSVFGIPRLAKDGEIKQHGQFIEAACRRHSPRFRSILELAAGPGYYAIWLAARGWEVTAVDRSQQMVEFCRDRARQADVRLQVSRDDIRELRKVGRVDVMLLMFDSVRLLRENADLVQHLEAVRRHLSQGGLYIVEYSHPRDQLQIARTVRSHWRHHYKDRNYSVTWSTKFGSTKQQIQEAMCRVTIRDNRRSVTKTQMERFRILLPRDFELACRKIGSLTIEEEYGDFKRSVSLDSAKAWRTIQIYRLRKSD